MLWTEIKYANLLSGRLERFKLKNANPYLACFRCPLCGDSSHNKTKSRGYIVAKKDQLKFYCHNCGAGMSFTSFLYNFDAMLYKEFRLEDFKEQHNKPVSVEEFATPAPVFHVVEWQTGLVPLLGLPIDHFARQYLQARRVPQQQLFWFCERFIEWGNSIIPGKFSADIPEHPRLILPLFDRENVAFGFCTRSFSSDKHDRYITLMLPEAPFPKVFGLERLIEDAAEEVFVLEGPIDSLFVENSVAMIGTSIDPTKFLLEPMKTVFVYDNECRNKQLINLMSKCLKQGYKIVIWPDSIAEKDINDAVLAGSITNPTQFLRDHIYSGASGLLRLNSWRKD